jgi:hypothetical protein
MKSELHKLLQYLNSEQRLKESIEIEYNYELKQIFNSDTVALRYNSKTKGSYFPALGKMESSELEMDLVRTNRHGKLIIKPKLIQEYLDRET